MLYETTKRASAFSVLLSIVIAVNLSEEIWARDVLCGMIIGACAYIVAENNWPILSLILAFLAPIIFVAVIDTEAKTLSFFLSFFTEFATVGALILWLSPFDSSASRQTP